MAIELNLPSELSLSAYEKEFADFSDECYQKDWLIKFNRVEFVHTDALLFIASLIGRRSADELATKVILPVSQKPFLFMLRWRFPEAVEAMTGKKFDEIFERQGDLDFIDRIRKATDDEFANLPYSRNVIELRDSKMSLRSNAFIDSLFYNVDTNGQGSIVRDQHEFYDDPYVKGVLEKKFEGSYRSAITNTLSELIGNAFEHPNASNIAVMSFCPKISQHNPEPRIELCVFDNGQSIPDTLYNALNSGFDIFHSVTLKSINVIIDVHSHSDISLIKTFDKSTIVNSVDSPKSLEELLVTSIFPGVSSRRKKPAPDAAEEFPEFRGKLRGDGNGLFISSYVACHLGRGILEIRTGKYLLRISADLSNTDVEAGCYAFSVHLTKALSVATELAGNMISVKMAPEARAN